MKSATLHQCQRFYTALTPPALLLYALPLSQSVCVHVTLAGDNEQVKSMKHAQRGQHTPSTSRHCLITSVLCETFADASKHTQTDVGECSSWPAVQ